MMFYNPFRGPVYRSLFVQQVIVWAAVGGVGWLLWKLVEWVVC